MVARSGGREGAQAVALALALPLGGCDVVLVLENSARELVAVAEAKVAPVTDEMAEQMDALMAEDAVEIVVRVEPREDQAALGRLRPGVRVLGPDAIEARCRKARHWLVL